MKIIFRALLKTIFKINRTRINTDKTLASSPTRRSGDFHKFFSMFLEVPFTEIAVKESLQTRSFYEVEVAGLGEKFSNEIKNALKRISNFPIACPILKNEIRKCVVRKFPYNLLYSIEQDFILILAVAHHHRKPFYWADESK